MKIADYSGTLCMYAHIEVSLGGGRLVGNFFHTPGKVYIKGGTVTIFGNIFLALRIDIEEEI